MRKSELEKELKRYQRDLETARKERDQFKEEQSRDKRTVRMLTERMGIGDNYSYTYLHTPYSLYYPQEPYEVTEFDYDKLHEDLKSVDNVEGAKKRLKPKTQGKR